MDGEITVLLIFWLICGLVASGVADWRGGSLASGFWLGLLLGPLGVIIALFIGTEAGRAAKQIQNGERKKCPDCAELVQSEAIICRFCGHEFAEVSEAA